MRNKIRILLLETILLSIITIVFVIIMGKTQTISFTIRNDDYTLNIDNNTGEVKVLEEKKKEELYIIKIKSVKPGKVYITLDNDDSNDSKVLYIHNTGIITDNNYFGYSRGSEIIPISLSIILIHILVLLIDYYQVSIRKNIYQYKNIALMGIIVFLTSLILFNAISIINYQGIYSTINQMMSSFTSLSFILFPIAFVTSILVSFSNIKLVIKEGRSLKNILGVLFGLFLCILPLIPDFVYKRLMVSQTFDIYNLNNAGPYIYDLIETLVYLVVVYLECILIGTIVVAVKTVRKKLKHNKDYMLILGCKIKEDGTLTPLLKGRVDKALAFRNEQLAETGKDLIFIPSGGKGEDEVISEAEAMKNYLIEKGISPKNIFLENKSKNTYENIKYSNKLIKKKHVNIAFSTTNYHVLRAGLLANEQGLYFEGIGSKTKAYYWINAFIREFIGTLYAERKKHLLMFTIVLIIIIIMIMITYLANNI